VPKEWVTASDVVQKTNTANFNTSLISSEHIDIAQERWMLPTLGQDMYDYMVGLQNFTGVYKTLVDDYLKAALAYYVMYVILPETQMKVTTLGVQTPDLYGSKTDQRTFSEARTQLLENATTLMAKAIRYIEDTDGFDYYKKSRNNKSGGVIFY